MKLWLLRPLDAESGPWNPWYDKAFGFVVRADTEADARALAAKDAGDEADGEDFEPLPVNPWQDPALASCVELAHEGDAGVIIMDFKSA